MFAERDPRRWQMLPVILIGSFLSFLDFFIVNIALPTIGNDLAAGPGVLQLIVAGYGIGFAVSLITGGRLGDRFGRRRVFLGGLAAFTVASMACGLAADPWVLVASRILQGVTAATLTPQVLAIIRVSFAGEERAFALGLYGASMGLASIVAQVLGGLLVSLDLFGWSWRLIFLINVPIGLAGIGLAARVLPESRSTSRAGLDWAGSGLLSVALLLLVVPLVEGREAGWPAWSFGMLAAAAPMLVAFVTYERWLVGRGRWPLVPLHLFRIPTVTLGLVASVVFFSGLAAFFVVLTVFLQSGLGYPAYEAGLMFLPFAAGFTFATSLSGAIAARVGGRILHLGTTLMALGLLGLLLPLWGGGVFGAGAAIPLLALYGLGQGLAQPAMINLVVGASGIGDADAGSAAGLFLTVAQSSIALGVAAIGDVFFAYLGPTPVAADYAGALSAALTCNLVLQVMTLVLVLLMPHLSRGSAPLRRGA